MDKAEEIIQELNLSSSVGFDPPVSKATMGRYVSEINRRLEKRGVGWRVMREGDSIRAVDGNALTQKEKTAFAEDILDWLDEKGYDDGVLIYDWRYRYQLYRKGYQPKQDETVRVTKKRKVAYVRTKFHGCPCEYNNPCSLTMTFDASYLYFDMEHGSASLALDVIAKKYGQYNEMGHAWSTAFYAL